MKKLFLFLVAFWLISNGNSVFKDEYVRPFYPPYTSQCGQDKYVNEHFFKNKKNGFFVDIGAHDGVSLSNTYFFEKELGWSGICVEPHPQRFKELALNRAKKTICLPVAVANNTGVMKFLQVDGYPEMLSGLFDFYDPRHIDRVDKEIASRGGSSNLIDIPTLPLSSILDKYHVSHIDFMSVDTEGSELEVLKSIDFNVVTIDVIAIENNYGESKVHDYLKIKGYRLAHRAGGDEIYVFAKVF